jgi:hypothetical protein
MIVSRDVPRRKVARKFAGDAAREVLAEAGFGRGRECFFLTAGQFSSVDWIDALLDYTGDAHGTIATWTAASADLDRVDRWVAQARLQSCTWIVDRSFPNRQPAICDAFRARFGDDAIRVFATHAKFTLLWNDAGWRVVALTSANLNHNARVEFFHAADDPDLFAQFREMVDDVFASQGPGAGFGADAEKAKPMRHLKQKSLFDKATSAGMKTALSVGLK